MEKQRRSVSFRRGVLPRAPIAAGGNRARALCAHRRNSCPPKSRGGLKEFHPGEQFSLFSPNQPGNAAGKFLIRLQIGEDQLLRVCHFGSQRDEGAARAHIDCLGVFLEGFVAHASVEQNRHRCRHTRSAPLLEIIPRVPVARLAPQMRPAWQEKFDAAHNNPHKRYAPSRVLSQETLRIRVPQWYTR